VYVMYHGHIVERLAGAGLVGRNRHPYTRGLVDALPRLSTGPDGPSRGIPGDPPPVGEPLQGCVFAPRCPVASVRCRMEAPERTEDAHGELACHHPLGDDS
jgi:oligopeptide/dipeptide ABC transporter ATP-binding protein